MLEERVLARDEQFNYTTSPYIQVGGQVEDMVGAQSHSSTLRVRKGPAPV